MSCLTIPVTSLFILLSLGFRWSATGIIYLNTFVDLSIDEILCIYILQGQISPWHKSIFFSVNLRQLFFHFLELFLAAKENMFQKLTFPVIYLKNTGFQPPINLKKNVGIRGLFLF